MTLGLPTLWLVIRRELQAAPRRKRFHLARSGVVGVGAATVIGALIYARLEDSSTTGLVLLSCLSMASLAVMCLYAAASAGQLIMREKEERTLGLLFMSEIPGSAFVGGKLFTALFSAVMTLLSLLPMFLFAPTLGGVSIAQILMAFGVILATAFLVACVGLLAGAASPSEKVMNGLLVLFLFVYFFALPVGLLVYNEVKHLGVPEEAYVVLSPFVAMAMVIQGVNLEWVGAGCALSLLLGLPALGLAQLLAPLGAVSRDRPPVLEQIGEKIQLRQGLRRWFQALPVRGNPVAWKDFHFSQHGWRMAWLKFAAFTVGVFAVVIFIWLKVEGGREISARDLEDLAKGTTGLFLGLYAAAVGLGALNECGRCFSREKKGRTLEVLLTSSLSDEEILHGKIVSVLLSLTPWILGLGTAGLLTLGMLIEYSGEGTAATVMTLEFLAQVFGYSALAFWLSLRFRKPVGFPLSLLAAMIYNFLIRGMLFVPFAMSGAFGRGEDFITLMVTVDVIVHVGLGILCYVRAFTSFRSLALGDME